MPYEPRLTSTPGYSQEIQVSGGDVSATSSYGGVSIAAADGKFDKEIARRIFEGLKTDVYIGNSSLEKPLLATPLLYGKMKPIENIINGINNK